MGKRSQGKARWAHRVPDVSGLMSGIDWANVVEVRHSLGPMSAGAVPGAYELMCGDCEEHFESYDLQKVYERARDHLCEHPKHDTFVIRSWDEGEGLFYEEDVPLWETVATWGPSVGLEVVTEEKAREWATVNGKKIEDYS